MDKLFKRSKSMFTSHRNNMIPLMLVIFMVTLTNFNTVFTNHISSDKTNKTDTDIFETVYRKLIQSELKNGSNIWHNGLLVMSVLSLPGMELEDNLYELLLERGLVKAYLDGLSLKNGSNFNGMESILDDRVNYTSENKEKSNISANVVSLNPAKSGNIQVWFYIRSREEILSSNKVAHIFRMYVDKRVLSYLLLSEVKVKPIEPAKFLQSIHTTDHHLVEGLEDKYIALYESAIGENFNRHQLSMRIYVPDALDSSESAFNWNIQYGLLLGLHISMMKQLQKKYGYVDTLTPLHLDVLHSKNLTNSYAQVYVYLIFIEKRSKDVKLLMEVKFQGKLVDAEFIQNLFYLLSEREFAYLVQYHVVQVPMNTPDFISGKSKFSRLKLNNSSSASCPWQTVVIIIISVLLVLLLVMSCCYYYKNRRSTALSTYKEHLVNDKTEDQDNISKNNQSLPLNPTQGSYYYMLQNDPGSCLTNTAKQSQK